MSKNNKHAVNEAITKEITKAVGNVKFGSILITVHNSRIVQIEVAEKKRFDDLWYCTEDEEGGGI